MQSVKQNQKKTNVKLNSKWWWRAHGTVTVESFEVNTMKSSGNIYHRISVSIQQLFHHFSRISQRFHLVLVSVGCLLRKEIQYYFQPWLTVRPQQQVTLKNFTQWFICLKLNLKSLKQIKVWHGAAEDNSLKAIID